ncbi:MAG: PLDc N-terminal domain-containing protein [Bacteroidota bacterium]|nr:PLDc N-terminal domain-containing protein [Bacteroidota bacterium]MDX5427068.1 PLDc N-terminal domain-containing protein [Bacteroidota bacterium]
MDIIAPFSLLVFIGVGLFGLIFPLIALIDILKSEFRDPTNKFIWVFVVIMTNIIGAVLYFMIGRKQRA